MGLRGRFDDFRRAFERREDDACRVALADFRAHFTRWTAAEERVLVPALSRVSFPGRDPERELRLEYVQIRELTRYLDSQIVERAPVADVQGLVENLERRLAAHDTARRSAAASGGDLQRARSPLRSAGPLRPAIGRRHPPERG